MKIIIFGATGSVGQKVVEHALQQGHHITAFTRDSKKLALSHPNLQTCIGDVLDLSAVHDAVRDHDAVICTLGAGRHGGIRANGTHNIIHAMEALGIRRLICQTSLGVGESRNNLDLFWKYIMFGMVLRAAYADHVEQEELVRKSKLDWIIVRPGAFTDGGHTGQYQHGFSENHTSTQLKISRHDVADFILKQLSDNHYLHQAPALSY